MTLCSASTPTISGIKNEYGDRSEELLSDWLGDEAYLKGKKSDGLDITYKIKKIEKEW